ncbi:hypothetical protein [Micromonospora sp. MA102]|uniref:hypothetical protein n=1 Tax=Micromonospora sp. MA102 TaxID=2952755 RepID=UPI0021C6AC79|nr:hypothetical protein [Micromonospora sp. MA102]
MKAHRTDIVSFAFGLAFLGLSAWWLLARILGLALPPVGWFLAGALILIGLLGLVGALRSGRHTEPPAAETTVSAPYETGTPAGGAGAPTTEEADEWATDAVTDAPLAAREDRPFDAEPRWSPGEPATRELSPVEPAPERRVDPVTRELPAATGERDGSTEPATRELPDATDGRDGTVEPATRELPAATEGPDGTAGPATRELPAVDDAADRPGGGPRTGGDGPG